MEDYEIDYETSCPKCDYDRTLYRSCNALGCEDGYIEEFEDDIEIEGTGTTVKCDVCYGTGIEIWCPNCGYDVSAHNYVMQLRKDKQHAS